MVSARLLAAVATGKTAGAASRSLGRGGGTALPGLLALKLAPNLVSNLAAQIPGGSILITGTNGKTTTSRMVATILRQWGLKPLHNRSGSNLMRGIATALLDKASLSAALSADDRTIGLFEVDEAVLPQAVEAVKPKVVAIGNLFRDQLDRYGEVDRLSAVWRKTLAELSPEAAVVLNGDDPLVADLGRGLRNRVVYFGVEDKSYGQAQLEHAADSKCCPHCGVHYNYSLSFYGHIGHYRCPSCGSQRPDPQIKAKNLEMRGFEGIRMELTTPATDLEVELALPGIYNVYNALAAAGVAYALGVPATSVKSGLESFTAAFGRAEVVSINGRRVCLLLVKNPVGLNAVLRALLAEEGSKKVLFVLNDGIADGRDVSWIWDADFERMAGATSQVLCSGLRAEDIALRLKYAGIASDEGMVVERDSGKALEMALERTPLGETLYLLPTYTAMLEVRELLTKLGHLEHFWEVD